MYRLARVTSASEEDASEEEWIRWEVDSECWWNPTGIPIDPLSTTWVNFKMEDLAGNVNESAVSFNPTSVKKYPGDYYVVPKNTTMFVKEWNGGTFEVESCHIPEGSPVGLK